MGGVLVRFYCTKNESALKFICPCLSQERGLHNSALRPTVGSTVCRLQFCLRGINSEHFHGFLLNFFS